jgi:hypothetical protein
MNPVHRVPAIAVKIQGSGPEWISWATWHTGCVFGVLAGFSSDHIGSRTPARPFCFALHNRFTFQRAPGFSNSNTVASCAPITLDEVQEVFSRIHHDCAGGMGKIPDGLRFKLRVDLKWFFSGRMRRRRDNYGPANCGGTCEQASPG